MLAAYRIHNFPRFWNLIDISIVSHLCSSCFSHSRKRFIFCHELLTKANNATKDERHRDIASSASSFAVLVTHSCVSTERAARHSTFYSSVILRKTSYSMLYSLFFMRRFVKLLNGRVEAKLCVRRMLVVRTAKISESQDHKPHRQMPTESELKFTTKRNENFVEDNRVWKPRVRKQMTVRKQKKSERTLPLVPIKTVGSRYTETSREPRTTLGYPLQDAWPR